MGLVGPDHGFVNTYGVWADELEKLDLGDTFERVYPTSVSYYGGKSNYTNDSGHDMNTATIIKRPYARVDRAKLRMKLLNRCMNSGKVRYLSATVTGSNAFDEKTETRISKNASTSTNNADNDNGGNRLVTCSSGEVVRTRAVAVASGCAGSNNLLSYQCDNDDNNDFKASINPSHADTLIDTPLPGAVQTAYGIEADVSHYPFDDDAMVFMDYRRHHTGLWPLTAEGMDPTTAWDSDIENEAPSFLYAMPVDGKTKVFLEETCLVARPVLPFEILKQRLYRRCEALGIKINKVHDEEWSYIPVGGAMPLLSQEHFGFGAAAGMVHPATGYSIARSLKEASEVAEFLAGKLAHSDKLSSRQLSEAVWEHIWSKEKRRQAAFNVFGMELLMDMPLSDINVFFTTFFRLPTSLWTKFLSNELDSKELIFFAMAMFIYAPNSLRIQLLSHLVNHQSGKAVVKGYLEMIQTQLNKL